MDSQAIAGIVFVLMGILGIFYIFYARLYDKMKTYVFYILMPYIIIPIAFGLYMIVRSKKECFEEEENRDEIY